MRKYPMRPLVSLREIPTSTIRENNPSPWYLDMTAHRARQEYDTKHMVRFLRNRNNGRPSYLISHFSDAELPMYACSIFGTQRPLRLCFYSK